MDDVDDSQIGLNCVFSALEKTIDFIFRGCAAVVHLYSECWILTEKAVTEKAGADRID